VFYRLAPHLPLRATFPPWEGLRTEITIPAFGISAFENALAIDASLCYYFGKGGVLMKKFGLLLCLLLGLTACGQSLDVETVDDPQPRYFATMEEAIEATLEHDFEEPLSVEKIVSNCINK
jgi:hypothetical protein